MILLAFLFLLLVIISLIYFTSKRVFKSLRIFGIMFSMPILLLYAFVKNVDLASTPVIARTTNKTNERLKVYYISFYNSYSPLVIYSDHIKPDDISNGHFEAEGVAELWMVAVNKNGRVRYLGKKKNVWSSSEVAFTIENSNSNYTVAEQNRALGIIKEFRINQLFENSLLIVSLAFLGTLILKRKKTTNQ